MPQWFPAQFRPTCKRKRTQSRGRLRSGLPRLPGKDGPSLGLDDPQEMNGPDVVFILGTFLVRECPLIAFLGELVDPILLLRRRAQVRQLSSQGWRQRSTKGLEETIHHRTVADLTHTVQSTNEPAFGK